METTWNMLDHARMHKGVKPYSCPYCGKRFTQKGNMRKHAKLHLTPHVDARRKYTCEFCGGKFTEKYNLMVRKRLITIQNPFVSVLFLHFLTFHFNPRTPADEMIQHKYPLLLTFWNSVTRCFCTKIKFSYWEIHHPVSWYV